VVNKLRGGLKVAASRRGLRRSPQGDARGHRGADAGEMIAEDLGIKLENVTLQMLGAQEGAHREGEHTIIDGAGKKARSGPRRPIKAQIEETTSD